MPYLRCEACGAKALPIATRCPSCEAPFEVRGNGMSSSGGQTGMRGCPGCDSLISRDAAECPWCGEDVAGRRSGRRLVGGAMAAVVLVAAGWALVAARSGEVLTLSPADPSTGAATVVATVSDPLPPVPTPTPDPTPDPELAPAPTSEASIPESVPPGEPEPDASSTDPAPSPAAESAPVAESLAPPVEASPEAETLPGGGWVRAVARTFVNVRSAPATDSEVQGVVAENAIVFLGDTRGAWRQVRSGSVAGWAWEPLFNVGSEGP